ncbi:MAG: hypothetical protein HRT44_12630 [Bdellovibrionales bacterium]|nr:hypothetical protein [Bdellovibrionales bacterium]NQZ20083.1 hypothetical protein [Bdellovibrionales bacterium]
MSGLFKRHLVALVLICSFLPAKAYAEPGREFLLSCTYGVLAGALVGAASLAVEDEPDEKIHRVARGASLGLYAGILLGLYVVYVVPAQIEAEEDEEIESIDGDSIEPDDYGHFNRYYPPKFTIYPVVEQNKVTGAAFNFNVIRF